MCCAQRSIVVTLDCLNLQQERHKDAQIGSKGFHRDSKPIAKKWQKQQEKASAHHSIRKSRISCESLLKPGRKPIWMHEQQQN